MKKSFNIQELLHCKSKPDGTKPVQPSLSRAFQRHQEHNLKHPGSVDLITIKQNKTRCLMLNGLAINLISTIDVYDKLVIARRIFLKIYFNVHHVVVKEKHS